MSDAAPDGPNAQQIAYWNDEAGPTWIALQEELDTQIEPLGLAVMERAAVASGESVLDIGCGCGQTALELARRVGPAGQVLGVDISQPMLARARERAEAAGLANLQLVEADAQTHAFEAARYDLLFSRFGVMFFEDPALAFANLRRSLKPGGRLAFLCWQGIDKNPWMLVPFQAIAPLVELPPPPDPHAPGPMAFADAERLRSLFEGAGFTDVTAERFDTKVTLAGGKDLERTIDFVFSIGPVSRAIKAGEITEVAPLRAAVAAALEPHRSDAGIQLGAGMWIYQARNPG